MDRYHRCRTKPGKDALFALSCRRTARIRYFPFLSGHVFVYRYRIALVLWAGTDDVLAYALRNFAPSSSTTDSTSIPQATIPLVTFGACR